MSVETRSLGYNWLLKYWSAAPTCTACSADENAIRFSGGTCTVIGGMDSFDIGVTREMIDVTSFEDTMNQSVPGRLSFDAVNMSGNLDPGDAGQSAMHDELFHRDNIASENNVIVMSATESVSGEKYTWKGYLTSAKSSVGVKDKATFALTSQPISKVMVCTVA